MSNLDTPMGGMLNELVEAQRGMTDWEADWFLRTGQLPDLSQPPVAEPVLLTDLGPVGDEAQARAFLAGQPLVAAGGGGAPSSIAFLFDPEQRRDARGRWTAGGSVPTLTLTELNRLRELEELAESDEGLDSSESRELKALQERKARDVPRTTRQLTQQEVLESAPVGIAGTYRGPTLVCRPETLATCAEDNSRKTLMALMDYRGMGFKDINGLLRRGRTVDMPEPVVRDWIDTIDRAMEDSRLPNDVQVMRGLETGRGIFGNALDFEDDLSGYEWTEKSYVSTTTNRETAEEFGEGGVILNIRVPAGTPAIQLSNAPTEESYDEAELLLGRKRQFRVVADHGTDRGGRRVLDVEMIAA